MITVKDQIFDYVQSTYAVEPDYPFSTAPGYPVLRHKDSRKWFALLMDVPRNRLGLSGEDHVDVINLKCSPAMAASLRRQEGFLPAYHMHRDNWITILLDGTVNTEDIFPLIDISFQLTDATKQPSGKRTQPGITKLHYPSEEGNEAQHA